MPPDSKTGNSSDAGTELDELAFQLFTARIAANPGRRGAEQEATESYRLAESFLAIRKRVRAGELRPREQAAGPQLADCCAPNLSRNHPHNLVAREYRDRRSGSVVKGDLAKVSRIKEWLDRNPTPEKDPEELVGNLGREFPELGWGLPEINTARAVFPTYCRN